MVHLMTQLRLEIKHRATVLGSMPFAMVVGVDNRRRVIGHFPSETLLKLPPQMPSTKAFHIRHAMGVWRLSMLTLVGLSRSSVPHEGFYGSLDERSPRPETTFDPSTEFLEGGECASF